ncbi:MAG: hypothetical protein LHV69_05895 [Elusimicrobia bacterium]|nr:hypothetical protein [Candidatus Obscuribacterium magneticum]
MKSKKIEWIVPALFWVLSTLLFFKSLTFRLYDPDLWWHLAAGREMFEKRIFLRTDVFSHTLQGTEWINFEWLGQILLYLLMKTWGLAAIYWGKILLGLLVMTLLILSARKAGARGPWLLLLAWMGFKVVQPRLLERVELATLLLLPIFMILLLRARKGAASQLKFYPWIFFLLTVLWCNLHAGFIYGLGLILLFDVGARWRAEEKSYIRMVDRALILSLAAVLFNPWGPRILVIFLEHLMSFRGGASLIQEWKAPSISEVPNFWFLFVANSLILVWGLLGRWEGIRFWTPAIVAFAAWGGFHYRTTALFAFVGLPFFGELLQQWRWTRAGTPAEAASSASLKGNDAEGRRRRRLAAAGWLLCLIPLGAHADKLKQRFPEDLVLWSKFPAGACRFVKANNVPGNMFNEYGAGGYLSWELGPKRKVFMDGRYLFYPLLVEQNRLNYELSSGIQRSHWPAYLEKNSVSYAIVRYPALRIRYINDDPGFCLTNINAMFPRSQYALVYWDDLDLVFLKRTKENAALINRTEYQHLWPYNLDQMRFFVKSKSVLLEKARAELERHKKEAGATVIGNQLSSLLK